MLSWILGRLKNRFSLAVSGTMLRFVSLVSRREISAHGICQSFRSLFAWDYTRDVDMLIRFGNAYQAYASEAGCLV